MENRDELRRKSIIKRLSNTTVRKSISNDQQLHQNNDSQERSRRQSDVQIQRRLSEIRSKSSNQLGRYFNEIEAKEHFQNCRKLFSENKITSKNVWHIQIIDILSHVVKEKKEKNLLQFAGTSLDISAKVYGIRVDEVHSFGLKLATNLTKTEKQKDNNDDDDDDDKSDNDDQQNPKKKTTRRKVKKHFQHTGDKKPTVDYDGTTLFAPLKKLQKPPFSMEDKVELGAVDNLLTMKLPMNPMGHTFRIFNNEKYGIKGCDLTVENKSTIEIELPNFQNCKICPQFDDFIVNQVDETKLNKFINSSVNNDLILDDNGLPVPELDGSIHDMFPVNDENNDNDTNDGDEDGVIAEQQQQQTNGGILEIVDTIPVNELYENEYGFNPLVTTKSGKFIEKIWAGPAHWKIKYIRRTNLKCSGNTTINQQIIKTRRKKKVLEIIDLNNTEPQIINYDLSEKIVNKRKSPSMNFDKVTLPLLCSKLLEFEKYAQELFLKPCTVRPEKQKTGENIEINVDKYDYNNPNDSLYCSQIDFNDNPDDDDDDDDGGNDDNIGDLQEVDNLEQLVDLPEMAHVSYLKYALHAKKINIKKLKKTVWEQLTNGNKEEKVEPVCFSKIYKELPDKVDTHTRRELSVALAFNSILYLSNEYFLKLIQKHDGNGDFEIMKL